MVATVGVDNVHGFSPVNSFLASGEYYDDFRATILSLGIEIVPLTSFGVSDLVGLRALHSPRANPPRNPRH